MLEAGWEFIGHGMHQKSMQAEEAEAELIQAVLDKLANFTGQRTRGWLSPGLKESADTPDILKAAGIDYLCDWVVDDLPAWMTTANGSPDRHALQPRGQRQNHLRRRESTPRPRCTAA